MELKITFELDGKHKQTSKINLSDWDLWNPSNELDHLVALEFVKFITETHNFLDRERESST